MDESKTYIKMCEKAEEVQKRGVIHYGDYFSFPEGKIAFTATNEELEGNYYRPRIWTDKFGVDFGSLAIWLPRQDQLQEMLFTENWRDEFHDFAYQVTTRNRDYYLTNPNFTSMEQMWLSYVIKVKYNKVWDGESWIIGKENEKQNN